MLGFLFILYEKEEKDMIQKISLPYLDSREG